MSTEAEHEVHVSTEAIDDLTAGAEMLAAAHAKAREEHPGYHRYNAKEIWCDSWACGRVLTAPTGIDCGEAAASIYEAHRDREAELLLAEWRGQASSPDSEENN